MDLEAITARINLIEGSASDAADFPALRAALSDLLPQLDNSLKARQVRTRIGSLHSALVDKQSFERYQRLQKALRERENEAARLHLGGIEL